MADELSNPALETLFLNARSRFNWTGEPITPDQIERIYALTKLGPTLANSGPARFLWLTSDAAKQRLAPYMMESNVEKTVKAPAAVIVAYDLDWPEKMPELFPKMPNAKDMFADIEARRLHGFRNGSLQAGYFIMAVRALGFDAGPMSGFDNAAVDKEFFEGTNIVSNLIVLVGHANDEGLDSRLPRLSFKDANTVL